MEYDDSPLTVFRDALPNPVSRASYERKFFNFLEFLNLEGESFESKCNLFVSKSRTDQK